MTSSRWRIQLFWVLKANIVIWIVNGLALTILILSGSRLSDIVSSAFFSKITLLETGIALLIAGAVAFSGSVLPSKAKEYATKSSERWSIETLKKSEKRANKFIAVAIIIFAESLLMSLFGF